TIDKGILSAGATITVLAVLQGVFGWFNPNDSSAPSALYYLIQGKAAIVGKLYGTVDFKIIRADISVVASASVTLTVEAYRPIIVELSIGVEISVSIKILFIRISFSFSTSLDLSFTIGSASTPPWIVDSSQPVPLMLRQQSSLKGRRRLSGAELQQMILGAMGATGTFDWKARAVFDTIQDVALSLVPVLTVAQPSKVFASFKLAAAPVLPPQVQIVMSLFAPNSVAVESRRAKEVRTVTDPKAAATPFNLLVTGMLRWALSSYTRNAAIPLPPPDVYALKGDLEAITEDLKDAANWQTIFTYETLTELMELNYQLRIGTP